MDKQSPLRSHPGSVKIDIKQGQVTAAGCDLAAKARPAARMLPVIIETMAASTGAGEINAP